MITDDDQKVAVVGLACRFPGAPTPEKFLANLRAGRHAMVPLTSEDLERAGISAALYRSTRYVRSCYPIDADAFDSVYFGYSAGQAEQIDPQQRILLECAVEALNRAAIDPERPPGRIGVFASSGLNLHFLQQLASGRIKLAPEDYLAYQFANDKDFLTTRISYKLNLRGPSISIQTACSSSLVAIHLACQSLLIGECDVALAGGVALQAAQRIGYSYVPGSVESPDGYCRPFDAEANGTVWGNGAGLVVLMRLPDAVRYRHRVLATIIGSAVNNDGFDKAEYTTPSIAGQAEVIRMAHHVAGIAPGDIGYLEAHGTGTRIGDPIEVAAASAAFQAGPTVRQTCAIGSVKSNIGHLGAAAGIAGLIKCVLSLQHRTLFPSLHYRQPNGEIAFPETPFYVNDQLRKWDSEPGRPRRAGVSSFGIGGSNAHVVLEEHRPASARVGRSPPVLLFSAKDQLALETVYRQIADQVATEDLDIEDVALSLAVGRTQFAHRRAIVHGGRIEAGHWSAASKAKGVVTGTSEARQLLFGFPGRGPIDTVWARHLSDSEPIFRDIMQRCLAVPERLLGIPTDEMLSASEQTAPRVVVEAVRSAITLATATLLQNWGLRPSMVVGSGTGEFAAAAVAGVMTAEDAMAQLTTIAGTATAVLPFATFQPQKLPYLSALRGACSGTQLATDEHWRQVLAVPPDGLSIFAKALSSSPGILLMFGGDQQTISSLVQLGEEVRPRVVACPDSAQLRGDACDLWLSAVRVWVAGGAIDWQAAFADSAAERIPLAPYPLRHGPTMQQPTAPVVSPVIGQGPSERWESSFEEAIAAIWSRAFGRTDLSGCDDFFELGGDSLMASSLMATINRIFGLDTAIETLFDRSTLREFVRTVVAASDKSEDLERVARIMLSIETMNDAEVEAALRLQ